MEARYFGESISLMADNRFGGGAILGLAVFCREPEGDVLALLAACREIGCGIQDNSILLLSWMSLDTCFFVIGTQFKAKLMAEALTSLSLTVHPDNRELWSEVSFYFIAGPMWLSSAPLHHDGILTIFYEVRFISWYFGNTFH